MLEEKSYHIELLEMNNWVRGVIQIETYLIGDEEYVPKGNICLDGWFSSFSATNILELSYW
jgi:hypothetical protein